MAAKAQPKDETKEKDGAQVEEQTKIVTCGLIMPISALDGLPADHWIEVKSIITEAVQQIENPQFTIKLVSDADDIGVIQKRIVQNVYNSDVVVCDVSGKNPNVMFELGLRLAFDKPTIIVKDDKTDYSFDTGIIEHLTYPRDLRFGKIVEFKNLLATKVAGTHMAASNDPNHSPFLRNFGKFQVASLSQTEVSPDKLLLDSISELQEQVALLRRDTSRSKRRLDGSLASGIRSIENALKDYQLKYPATDIKSKLGDREFVDTIEKLANAPNYFRDPDEFHAALELVLESPRLERLFLAR